MKHIKHYLPHIIISGATMLSVGLVIAALQLTPQSSKSIDTDSQVLRQSFVDEFTGSYTRDIEKSGVVKEMTLIAAEGEVELFEGVKTKIWSYNNSIPGPEIRIQLGDSVKLHFINNLPQPSTIHFHGIRVPNAMDGVPGVTQDPVQPGETFTYEFTPKDAGTFWFHPHVNSSEQMEKGLYGTFIVEDTETKEYSKDVTWVIDDWRLGEDYQVYPYFNTPHDLMHDGRWGNVITVNGSRNERIPVQPGERILLRLVNTSNARVYRLNFGELDAKAIAVDGMYVKRVLDANGFELAPGNRIDVDITIPESDSGKTFSITDTFTNNVNTLGQIIIEGNTVASPRFLYPVNANIPDWKDADSLSVDKEYVLDARRSSSGGMGMMGGIEWTINGKAFPEYDPYELRFAEFNKIRFINNSTRLHPMHLHGQFFKVLSRNGKPAHEDFFRDTVLIHPKESIEIGVVPLDKGEWANHCHILEHAEAGMMTITSVK